MNRWRLPLQTRGGPVISLDDNDLARGRPFHQFFEAAFGILEVNVFDAGVTHTLEHSSNDV